ncbi:UNVERIFIED_CONTAM: hypothetical protein GTU68_008998 [Idotea baltica]|nr:hypothetical protein [Idotea baltica]
MLFDLDGTLLNSAPDFIATCQDMRKSKGLAPIDDTIIRNQISRGAQAIVSHVFEVSPADPQFATLQHEFLQNYQKNCAKFSYLFEGINNLLDALEEKGITWGVVTNKHLRYAEPIMKSLGLSDRSAILVCPDHVKKPKPAPEPLHLACETLKLNPSAVLYVGDDQRDILSGNAAGTLTAAVTYGYIHPDDDPNTWNANFIIKHPDELQEFIL